MSTLLVIRHGQASFGAANYDVLSELGERQSQELGRYLARAGVRADAVYSGPLKRQVDTASLLSDAPQFPEAQVEPRFSEFPAFRIVALGLPALIEAGAFEPERAAAFTAAAHDPVGERRMFETMFRTVMRAWAEGDPRLAAALAELESFADFRRRVLSGLHDVMRAHGRGQTVVIVTSAGTVGASLAAALSLSPWESIKASLVVANTAMTRFKYRDVEDITLDAFNTVPHLQRRALLTLR